MSEAKPDPARSPVVWVFGGGITGLSVAHECIERGYEVYVVEPAEDSWNHAMPAVGGLARTQWAYIPPHDKKKQEAAKAGGAKEPSLVRALPFVRHPSFEFQVGEIDEAKESLAGPATKGSIKQEVATALKRFARRARVATRGAGYQNLTVALLAPMTKSGPPIGGGPVVTDEVAGADPSDDAANTIEAKTPVAEEVRDLILGMLEVALREENRLSSSAEVASRERDILLVEGLKAFRVEVRVEGRGVVPGEHGFRYFPGFYRHLFDTMRRTPVLQPGEDRFGPAVRTVFDNLVSTEATWLVVDPEAAPRARREARIARESQEEREARVAKEKAEETREPRKPEPEKLVSFPRRPPESLQQTLTILESFVRELGYSAQDVSRLTTKLFQYMTTSTERRAAEFEDLTWWDFIEGERFTDVCRRHMELGPEVLGAMTASESETRTQGNCVTQLLIDQLMGRKLTDATLNGPTSVAWFDPWRDYLTYRGVKFLRGKLVGFAPPPPPPSDPARQPLHRNDVLLPLVIPSLGAFSREKDAVPMEAHNFDTALRTHYFVIAAPVTAMFDVPEFNLVEADFSTQGPPPTDPKRQRVGPTDAEVGVATANDYDGFGLARKFALALGKLKVDTEVRVEKEAPDIHALLQWQDSLRKEQTEPDVGLGPLRHLTGVQYLFDNNVQFGQEHTLYMDSPWRLSSISQAHFWRRRPTGIYGYRGIVSVDIGALHRSAEIKQTITLDPPRTTVEQVATANGFVKTETVVTQETKTETKKAWLCNCDEIANAVWAQVSPSIAVDTQAARQSVREPSGATVNGLVRPTVPSLIEATPDQRPPRNTRNATGWRELPDLTKKPAPSVSIVLPADGGERLKPSCYHLDEGIVFTRGHSTGDGIAKNLSPYLINRPGEWKVRPGAIDSGKLKRGYAMQNQSWVLAGTYMKTFTRLTTMEAANESARHAVNAILEHAKEPGDRCMIWDPEEMELPDFMDLKEIDRRLFLDGYPHFVDILGIDEIPAALLPSQLDLKVDDHA